MNKFVVLILLIITMLFVAGCGSVSVEDINKNPDDYVGKSIKVSGIVIAPLKLGTISGFTLKDGRGNIIVSSDVVPNAKEEVTIKGTVVKGLLMPHYIYADKVIVNK